ncbi:hypothetical protein RRG08_021300 [Elysia crispata]|uniref:Uncharacterized protein n=1 Tax=Elysia crispata TaxID=231223 RepID=A0AAE0ZB19_9GAST|nr:hypothetical protein RRG08_021300 [Elysia crispata]
MVPNRISTVIEELSDLEMVPNRRSNRRVKIPRDGSKQKSMVRDDAREFTYNEGNLLLEVTVGVFVFWEVFSSNMADVTENNSDTCLHGIDGAYEASEIANLKSHM